MGQKLGTAGVHHYGTFSFSLMLFSLLKHYLNLYKADTVCSESLLSLYGFTSSGSHGIEIYFLGLWGMGISDAIFFKFE